MAERQGRLSVTSRDPARSLILARIGMVFAFALNPSRHSHSPSPTEWVPLGHPGYLKQQTELSLRRLRVETIDLLQLHRLDPAYPIADQCD